MTENWQKKKPASCKAAALFATPDNFKLPGSLRRRTSQFYDFYSSSSQAGTTVPLNGYSLLFSHRYYSEHGHRTLKIYAKCSSSQEKCLVFTLL
jgi:hypothetical protein